MSGVYLNGWWIWLSLAMMAVAAGCGDSGGGTNLTNNVCMPACGFGETCVGGVCMSTNTSSNGTGNSNTTVSNTSMSNTTVNQCADDCAQPDSFCEGNTLVTFSGAGVCMGTTCDYSTVQTDSPCEFFCNEDIGECTTGDIGSA
ncbi:MAG: hypothetical protein AAFX99_19625, partial [Myxococcota bacterium]